MFITNPDKRLEAGIIELEGPIVVFGAGGFIGANLMRAILKIRQDCYGVTHQDSLPWRMKDLPLKNIVRADLNDPSTVSSIIDQYGFRTIFNLAAYGGYSKQNEVDLIYRTNVLGAVNLLEAALRRGFSAYVHTGSSSEYGLNSAAPKENDRLMPNSHYAVSKIANAFLLQYLGGVKSAPVINLRLYSVYGPFEEPDRLIPRLIEYGMRGTFPLMVEPEISRDFVYVDDAIEAMVLAATTGVKKMPGGSINIATGKKTKIREIVQTIGEIFELKMEPVWGGMQNRSWDLKEWYGDPSLTKQLLGWEARTSLKEGLLKTLDWTRGQGAALFAQAGALLPAPKKISAVIACYRDGQAIPVMYDRLTKVFAQMKVDHEIIFVNDGSPDNSNEVLQNITLKDRRVIAIEHSRNFGSQSSFLSGMEIASGDAVVLLDGDLQDPPEIIPEFYKKWLEGYEVVYGRRVKREATKLLNACYKTFYKIFRGMAYIPMPLDAGDFSLIDRKVVNELIALPETDQFLRGLRAWVGFKQTGVDYERPERLFGATTNNWRKNIWWAKKAIFSFSFVPLEILSYFSVVLTGISFLALMGQIIARIFMPSIPQGITTVIVLILFFGGIQMLSISVIGEYLMKIFEEAKKRPKFIRKAIWCEGQHYRTAEKIKELLRGKERWMKG